MADSIRSQLATLANGGGCSNPGLALERYAKCVDSRERKGDSPADPLFSNAADQPVSPVYKAAFERWKKSLESMPGIAIKQVISTDRVIVGLGSESVLETAITLNRIYGVPMIPGSALKGVARSFYEKELQPADTEDLKKHRDTGDELFGWEAKDKGDQGKEKDKAKSGCVTFFDAWYVPGSAKDDRPLQPDVITVHHPKYYQNSGTEAPTDFDDPNPVGFISARGSFLLAVQGPDEEWTNLAMDVLTRALEHYGVGGKTSSGYGRLVQSTDVRGPTTQGTSGSPKPVPPPPSDPEVEQVKATQPNQVKSRERPAVRPHAATPCIGRSRWASSAS